MRVDGPWEVDDTAAVRAAVTAARQDQAIPEKAPFDLAVPGDSEPGDDARHALRERHQAAGATWWIEGVHPWRYGGNGQPGPHWPDRQMLERIEAGP